MNIKKIVCCTDFSENAREAVGAAIEMAEKYKANLSIVHVLSPIINPMFADAGLMLADEPNSSLILKLEKQMQEEYGAAMGEHINLDLVVLNGHASTEILQYLEENETDLVIMGSFGLSGMGLVVFGSVAKRIAHKAPCSVMIVRKS